MLEAGLFYIIAFACAATCVIFLTVRKERAVYITFGVLTALIASCFLLMGSVLPFLALLIYVLGIGVIFYFCSKHKLYKEKSERSKIKPFFALAFCVIAFVVLTYFISNEAYQTVFLIPNETGFSLSGLKHNFISTTSALIHRYYFHLGCLLFCLTATAVGFKIAFAQNSRGDHNA